MLKCRRGAVLALLMVTMGRAETLPIRSYTVADGLAHDHVSRIFRDSLDFLWICTDEGLSRFDGRRFVNYTTADGLPHIHVNAIVETRGGDYWIATDGGVTLFTPGGAGQRFATFKPDGPPQALFTNAVLEEPDGAVLVGTAAGLYRLRHTAGSRRFERIDFGAPAGEYEGAFVNTIHSDASGNLWVGATTGLYRRDAGGAWTRFTTRDGLPGNFVDRIEPDRAGRIWVCTRAGLGRVAPNPRSGARALDLVVTDADGLPNRDVRSILFTRDGRRWIGTFTGLVEWDPDAPAKSAFRIYTQADGLSDPAIYALAEGPGETVWVGSRRGGLARLSRPVFESFGEADGLAFSENDAIVKTNLGDICIAAISDPRPAIHCFDGHRFNRTAPHLPLGSNAVRSYNQNKLVDHTGDWWVASNRGLFRFHGSRQGGPAGEADLRLLPGHEPQRLYEDSGGDLWIAVKGLSSGFDIQRWQRATSQLSDLSGPLLSLPAARPIMSIAEAPPGQMWIGLGRPGGLFRLRGGRFEKISAAPGGNIEALYRDRSGRLWIASTDGGMGLIDQPASEAPAVRLYGRVQGLSSNEIWCLTEDGEGRIYAGTGRGVDRLDPASGRIVHYSRADGLKGDIRGAACDRRGDLWFLSNSGLFRLRPRTGWSRHALPARIMNIRVAGAPQAISEIGETAAGPAEFAWDRNSVQIDFSAIDIQSIDAPRYQFRLEGGQEDWSDPSPGSTVYFSSLAPGRYRFLVRAINSDGLASPSPASFAFTISPPPWRRWWFQALAAGIVIGLFYLWHRATLNRQLALERVRSGIATDLHDDIGASLSRIAVMSEATRHRVSATDGDSRRMLADIAETSRRLVDGMSDIVWSIDPRRDHLGDMVARLRAFGSDVLESRGIRWTCEGSAAEARQELSPDQRRQVYLIFKEAIHNIARHSDAANVTLRIRAGDNRLFAEIEDDGRGIPPDPGDGLGLSSMRDRAERLGGELEIDDRSGGGTRITLGFRLKPRNA